MGVDQQGRAEKAIGLLDQTRQSGVIRPPAGLKAVLDFVGWNAAAIDGLAACGNARDHAQACCNTRRPMIEGPRQGPFEHPRIKLVGLAVGVDVRARKTSREQRNTQGGCGGKQLVDEGVLRSAERRKRHSGNFQKICWVEVTAVRRSDDRRQFLAGRQPTVERNLVGCRRRKIHFPVIARAIGHVTCRTLAKPMTPM